MRAIEVFQPAQMHAVGREWIARMNNRELSPHERAKAVGELHTVDMRHYSPKKKTIDPESKGWIEGRKNFVAWEKGAFTRMPSLRYTEQCMIAEGSHLFFIYNRQVDEEQDMTVGELFELVREARDLRIKVSMVLHV